MGEFHHILGLALASLLLSAEADPPAAPPSPGEIADAAPPSAWMTIPAEDLLVMDLENGRRVVIALAPAFAPIHVANIRALVRARRFDGATINRVHDNYVVQWSSTQGERALPSSASTPPAEYERPLAGLNFRPTPWRDSYATRVGHADGWPVATDGRLAWLPHCYGMVGVGRAMPPDTGTGEELYAVIGHGPRHLDRNIALVGRVLLGIEALSALPRGSEALGFYAAGAVHPPIGHVRIAADMAAEQRPTVEIMRSDSPAFRRWLDARANRRDGFFVRPANAVDLCNTLPPTRVLRDGRS